MTVGELIEALQKFRRELYVGVADQRGVAEYTEDVHIEFYEADDYFPEGMVEISGATPGGGE